jgi:hypothetical protein
MYPFAPESRPVQNGGSYRPLSPGNAGSGQAPGANYAIRPPAGGISNYGAQPGYGNNAAHAAAVHPSLQRTPATNPWSTPAAVPQGNPHVSPYQMVSDGGMQQGIGVGSPSTLPAPQMQSHDVYQQPMQPSHVPHQGHHGGYDSGVTYPMQSAPQAHHADCNCSACGGGSSIYMDAASAPWDSAPSCGPMPTFAGPVAIKPWFGSASLLLFSLEDDCNRRLVFPDAMPSRTMLQTQDVDPDLALGFETSFGRYFACGKYALSGTYLYLNPDSEEASVIAPMPGDYRVAMPLWNRMTIDRDNDGMPDDVGTPGDNTDDHIYGAYDSAQQFRIRRDVAIQGLELNFTSFGIGGASRAGCESCGGMGCGPGGNACYPTGCGGMGGPMFPACNSRVQFALSHGVRWFQFRDEFELAGSLTANGFGSGIDDYYHNVDIQNDLIGYQFGSRVDYCLTRRVNVYAGAKFGIYGNEVDYHARIGTRGATAAADAYYPSYTGAMIDVSRSRTVLSTLGEIELGAGVRLTNCWTFTTGYRLIGASGIATSVGSISEDPANIADGHLTCVDDSLLLHGAQFGLNYNW